MDVLNYVLYTIGNATGAVTGTASVTNLVVKFIRDRARNHKTAEVLAFVRQLGLKTDHDVRVAVESWTPPKGFTPADLDEVVGLLTNLTRGARFHSTQGTPLSSYLKCERLIEQLLQNVQPKRRAGEKLDSWVLQSFLGMGSFGEVWRAKNPLYPGERAFKFFTQDGAREWLKDEAKVLFAVKDQLRDCPNVIDYLDVVVEATPFPYLVLEFARGGSLEDWILDRPEDRVPLDVPDLIRGIVRGVAAAHRHQIYHRDLKPANILLSDPADPVPKVADFGLARVDDRSDTSGSMRSFSALVGTRMYHPPEVSDPLEERDPARDDVFAIGVIWYQVLTGRIERPPYDFADRLAAALVDSRSVRMVSRCLAHPDRRYPSAGELYDELDRAAPPGPGEWSVPNGCFDVAGLAREYIQHAGG